MLHGGTGIPKEMVLAAVGKGMAKINVATAIRQPYERLVAAGSVPRAQQAVYDAAVEILQNELEVAGQASVSTRSHDSLVRISSGQGEGRDGGRRPEPAQRELPAGKAPGHHHPGRGLESLPPRRRALSLGETPGEGPTGPRPEVRGAPWRRVGNAPGPGFSTRVSECAVPIGLNLTPPPAGVYTLCE